MPWIFSIFLKIHQCQPSLLGDRFYPSACIHMILHQAKADGFIDIAADKNHPERQFPHQACQTYRRNNHEPHKCNLKNHAVGCISRRTIGIILDPVFRHPHCTGPSIINRSACFLLPAALTAHAASLSSARPLSRFRVYKCGGFLVAHVLCFRPYTKSNSVKFNFPFPSYTFSSHSQCCILPAFSRILCSMTL